jgi:hypothetical protein
MKNVAKRPWLFACSALIVLLASPARADWPQASLTKVARGKTLPPAARPVKKELGAIVRHYRQGNTSAGDAAWEKLAKRLYAKDSKRQGPKRDKRLLKKKHLKQAAEIINYVAYQAHVSPQPKLARIVDRLDFYTRLETAIEQQGKRLRTALRTIAKGQKTRLRIVTFNMNYRPGLDPVKQDGASRLDEEGLKAKQVEISKAADKATEQAKATIAEARRRFKEMLRLIDQCVARTTNISIRVFN